MLVNLAARNGKQAIASIVVNLDTAQDCFKQKQKQKSTKEHHRAKRAEGQEDTDSDYNEMFVATSWVESRYAKQ